MLAVPMLYVEQLYNAVGIDSPEAVTFVRKLLPFLLFKFVGWAYTSFLISCQRPDLSVYANGIGMAVHLLVLLNSLVMGRGLGGVCDAMCLSNLARFGATVVLA